MTFIVYSQINDKKVNGSLGMPEYSYYFVLRGFLPVLKALGEVVTVSRPDEQVDAIYDDCLRRREKCIFMTFSPPNKSVIGLRCPTVCVFAWEFDRIPDEVWDDNPKNDWRYVLSDHGCAITLSRYSADAVRKAMGENFLVDAIPVPVWDNFSDYRRHAEDKLHVDQRVVSINGNILDSRNYDVTYDAFEMKQSFAGIQLQKWSGETLFLGLTKKDEFSAYLGGFYEPEPWGSWSRIERPWVLLPYPLSGHLCVKICARGYGNNIGKRVFVSIGDEKKQIQLESDFSETSVDFHMKKPQNLIQFSGLDLSPVLDAPDPRTMGIGLRSIELSGSLDVHGHENETDTSFQKLNLHGVVYTSVFNPRDERKNWKELAKAFCLAFQDVEDATLVLKMTHHSVTSFLGEWHYLLQQLGPFKCRIVAVHGFLTDQNYEHLISATHFYVNASRGEGLCLPLMEFMSCGTPAIAPCNTSLADYVDRSSTLIVQSSLEPGIWPHDPRQLFRALQYRIDMESLVDAYRRSYDIVKRRPVLYRKMAKAALLKMEKYASHRVVNEQVKTFINKKLCSE